MAAQQRAVIGQVTVSLLLEEFQAEDLAEDDADELVFAAQLLMHQQPYQQRCITQGSIH